MTSLPPRPLIALLGWLALLLAAALAATEMQPPAAVPANAPPAQFSSGRAMVTLRTLARQTHPTGSPAAHIVRDYLLQRLTGLGLQPRVQVARVVRPVPNAPFRAALVQNIVAWLPGTGPTDGKAILLVAHYDSVPWSHGASDDGAGVAAILETIRALKAGPPLKRDIIILFTDGEELGMLGAQAFVERNPWVQNVGVVLNFEARGNGGPSFMFETSDGNGDLIQDFAQAAEHPAASSLMYTLYRLLPNDTDLTVFKKAGLLGYNFAYVGGVQYYHSPNDNLQNLNERSLQHHGSYALSLSRYFGARPLPRRAPDAIYFNLPGGRLVHYPSGWALPLSLLCVLLFVGLEGWRGGWVGGGKSGVEGWVGGRVDGWKGGWVEGWMEEKAEHPTPNAEPSTPNTRLDDSSPNVGGQGASTPNIEHPTPASTIVPPALGGRGLEQPSTPPSRLLRGMGVWAWAVVAAAVAAGLMWMALREAQPDTPATARGLTCMISYSCLGLAVVCKVYRRALQKLGPDDLATGLFLVWVALSVLTSLFLPGVSYLFTWPLLFSLAGEAWRLWRGDRDGLVATLCAIPAVLLWVPILAGLYLLLSVTLPPALIIIGGLFLPALLLPLLAPFRPAKSGMEGWKGGGKNRMEWRRCGGSRRHAFERQSQTSNTEHPTPNTEHSTPASTLVPPALGGRGLKHPSPNTEHLASILRVSAAVLTIGAAVVGLGGLLAPSYADGNDRRDSLLYVLDRDRGEAFWLTADGSLDAWTKQVLPSERENVLPRYEPFRLLVFKMLWGRFRTGPAPLLNLPAPVVSVQRPGKAGWKSGGMEGRGERGGNLAVPSILPAPQPSIPLLRTIHLRIRSVRHARSLALFVDPAAPVIGAILDGNPLSIPAGKNPKGFSFYYVALPAEGIRLDLRVGSQKPVRMLVMDLSDGLPSPPGHPLPPRPPHYLPMAWSDVRVVAKGYQF